jgi:hypothetical protein
VFRAAGVALTLPGIRGIMVAMIRHQASHLFDEIKPDGSRFQCSETFVRKYLQNQLGWSLRRATKAAQKVPADYERILMEAFLREAYVVRNHAVPAALRVNTDQTNIIYQQGTTSTWEKRGAKQVATIGQEEKRAFTLVPSISASGELLLMQLIYFGKTDASCPSKTSAHYRVAMELRFGIEPSKSSTYWSTIETMKKLVIEIISPYFELKKKELGLSQNQHAIWKVDCWSVHRSREFIDWMEGKYPLIIVIFIPGGCTGLWQPLDVGVQRVMKQSIKRSAHRDVVDEFLAYLADGKPPNELLLDTRLPTLRNRSLGWVVEAYHDINNPILIKKACIHHLRPRRTN